MGLFPLSSSEIEWMPSVEQIAETVQHAFKDKFPSTYSIIDGSEIFLETPSDLHMQSSTWSQYKHHNTAKFLVVCTPNGAVSYTSPLYVGSISDVELTRVSGFLTKLENKPGISIMADRGLTIKDLLSKLSVELNIPPSWKEGSSYQQKKYRRGERSRHLGSMWKGVLGELKILLFLKEHCSFPWLVSLTRLCAFVATCRISTLF